MVCQDGWLSAKSARLYDYQVEALFLDTADTPPPPRSLTLPLRAPSPLARLYDYQVESLFLGTADAMRRQIMPEIAAFMRGKNPRDVKVRPPSHPVAVYRRRCSS